MDIRNFAGHVMLRIDADTLSGADLSHADLSGANLSDANLSDANLYDANLYDANLYNTDLSGADLSGADLSYANLSYVDLAYANLSHANLSGANLSHANLSGANLSHANLSDANLSDANLSDANLSDANLFQTDLSGAENIPSYVMEETCIVPEGSLIVWKQCRHGVIVKLAIPVEARRSNATSRKCRAEYADVLEVIGSEEGYSLYDNKTVYKVGQRVTCDYWEQDRWIECGGGIHFFLTREEAESYQP